MSSNRRRRSTVTVGAAASSARPIPPSPNSKNSKRPFFWNALFQKRRSSFKEKAAHDDPIVSDTLLPKSYKLASPQMTGRKQLKAAGANNPIAKPTNLCSSVHNSFLMGGVDKRRYRRKPKGLLHRIFLSSLPRKLMVGFAMLYFVVYHVLVPVGSRMVPIVLLYFFEGDDSSTSTNSNDANQNYDPLQGLVHSPIWDNLRSVPQERHYLKQVYKERETIRKYGSGAVPSLSKVLEGIDPAWFHRFDADFDSRNYDRNSLSNSLSRSNSKSNSKEAEVFAAAKAQELDRTNATAQNEASGAEQQQQQQQQEDQPPNNTNEHYHKPVVDPGTGSIVHRRLLEVRGGMADELEPNSKLLPLRTLDTMDHLGAKYSSCGSAATTETAVTLVVQTSIDRLWILGETCSRWTTDPIVGVVFVPHSMEEQSDPGQYAALLEKVTESEKHLLKPHVCPNLTLVRYKADRIESLNGRYPVNRLRNVGLDLVSTSHVLTMDVDFVPSRDLEPLARTAIANADHDRRALVVPAFEKKAPVSCAESDYPESCISRFLKHDGAFLPRTFDELHDCYTSKDCVVFQSEYNWDGHSTTNSERWMEKQWYEESNGEAKTFRSIPCFHTARYEPYVIVEWCPLQEQEQQQPLQRSAPLAPYYDERFYGYGKNKIELVSHLRRSGYRFAILPEGFLVHNPHPESATKETWLNHDQTSDLHASMDALYKTFMDELLAKYKAIHADTTKLCHHR